MNVELYDVRASMLGMYREFLTVLEVKGYRIDYNEFKGGHGYINWKRTLSDVLNSIFGSGYNGK